METNDNRQPGRQVFVPPPMPKEAVAFGVKRGEWIALRDAIFPSAKTAGAIMLALSYCRARNLDPFKRVVHIVPMYNSNLNRMVETVWPGIAEHRTTAQRSGAYAGNDEVVFGPWKTEVFEGETKARAPKKPKKYRVECHFPEFAQMTVYKIVQGQRVAFVGPKIYWKEYFGQRNGAPVPNERWTRAPSQMIEKCAEAAALRRAFPEDLGSVPTAEEMDGRTIDAGGVVIDPPGKEPTRADFKDGNGTPQDGVEFVETDEDDDDADVIVDQTPAEVVGKTAEASTKIYPLSEMATDLPDAPGPSPAASFDPGPDVPAEAAKPAAAQDVKAAPANSDEDAIDAEAAAEEQAVRRLKESVDGAIRDLDRMSTAADVQAFAGRFKLVIETSTGVPAVERGKQRARFQQAALERQRIVTPKGGRR